MLNSFQGINTLTIIFWQMQNSHEFALAKGFSVMVTQYTLPYLRVHMLAKEELELASGKHKHLDDLAAL